MKKHIWKIAVAVVALFIVVAAFVLGTRYGADGGPKEEALPTSAVSAAEVAHELIAGEEKKEKEKKASSESAVPPAAHMHVQPPALSDKIFYIEGNVNLEKANSLKEITIRGIYGGDWSSMWMHSTLLFHKTAYKAQEVSDRIQLLVHLRPTMERNDNNYITLNFDIYPPKEDEKRWSATVSFDSRTQGRTWFPLAYDVFIQDWQKAEILNLAERVLDIALTQSAD